MVGASWLRASWDSAKSDLWHYLKEDTSIAVVHLKRENLLHGKVSASIAQFTGKWGVGATGGIANGPTKTQLSLDFDECLQDFNAHRRMETEADELFANHRKLNLTYEEIVADFAEASNRVQAFLELGPRNAKN